MQILIAKIFKKNNCKLLVTDKNKNAPCRHIADKFYDDTTHVRPFSNISINNFLINAGFKSIVIKPLIVKN